MAQSFIENPVLHNVVPGWKTTDVISTGSIVTRDYEVFELDVVKVGKVWEIRRGETVVDTADTLRSARVQIVEYLKTL